MNPLAPYMTLIKVGILAILIGGIFSAGAVWNGKRWETKYNILNSKYEQFVGGVAAIGHAAEAANAKQALNDLKAKERADDENKRVTTALRVGIERMRHDRDSARSSIVPPAPAGSKCPDGQACFDRAELERTLRDYRSEVRGLVDEGSAVTVDLDTAKKWALELKLSTTLKGN